MADEAQSVDAVEVSLRVNGVPRTVDAPPQWRLLDLLRDGLRLTGTKEGCDDGACGTCTVMVDGAMVRACRTTAHEVAGKDVLTIEGLGTPEHPHPLQRAFLAADAVQCGFCTPGMIMAAAALLKRNPHPTRDQVMRWIGSNLCRCTGYQSIADAILWAADGETGEPRVWPVGFNASDAAPGDVRVGGMDKVTGRAVYAADLAMDGMLHARVLRSPHAHAEILQIHTDRARAMPGVAAVLTASDVPGLKSYGRKLKDEPVLAAWVVRKVGDPVALVVAATAAAADAALAQIDVEYRVLPAVFTPEDALAPGAPQVSPDGNLLAEHWLRSGDIEKGFAEADVVIDQIYTTPWNEHAYLEPEAAVAWMDGDTLVLRSSTQHSHYHRGEVARALGLPNERVRVLPTVVGGAFGGKTDISCQALVALAAFHTGRPVRIQYSRAESFATTTKRHPYRIRCRTGAMADGRLVALQMDMLADTGAYASSGPGRMVKAFSSATGPYRWPHVELHGRVVHTNNPTAGSMRGPGTTQAAFAIESQMDLLAQRLGIDPLELRSRNRLRSGDRLLSGQILEADPAYGATIEAVRPHYEAALARRAEADTAAGASGTRRRGVGVASLWYGIGGGPRGGKSGQGSAPASGRAVLELRPDGSIVVRTGAVDLGQGSDTALGMIAAATLGISVAGLSVETGDTAANANAGPSGGSRVTLFVGGAVRDAAGRLRDALLETAAAHLGRPSADLVLTADAVAVHDTPGMSMPLRAVAAARTTAGLPNNFEGTFNVDIPKFDAASGLGEAYPAYVSATEVAEVEVDTATGAVTVIRIVAAHDVGQPVFVPGIVGQIEGGIVMGLGFALAEDFVPGETQGFKQYRIPRAADAPEMISFLVSDNSAEPLAKGVAESSNMVAAPAVVNAIANATGTRVVDLPVRLGRGATG